MAERNLEKLHQLNVSATDKENPNDLLHRFSLVKTHGQPQFTNLEQQPDLNLGLSLGGIYTEHSRDKLFLARSSSIAGVMTVGKESREVGELVSNSFLSLARSCSLPTGVEQEQRQVNLRELLAMNLAGKKKTEMQHVIGEEKKNCVSKSPALYPSLLRINSHERSSETRKLIELERTSTAKSMPDDAELLMNSRMVVNGAAEGSLGDSTSSSEPRSAETALTIGTTRKSVWPADKDNSRSKKVRIGNERFKNEDMDVMKQMPSVTTTGDGPEGRRVEGFLYKYMKGQVSIVCVCHGSFLSPAEFVRHAGGKDVSNPMKRISVFPTAFSY